MPVHKKLKYLLQNNNCYCPTVYLSKVFKNLIMDKLQCCDSLNVFNCKSSTTLNKYLISV